MVHRLVVARPWRARLLPGLALASILAAVIIGIWPGRLAGQSTPEKLSTVLADLAADVPQDLGLRAPAPPSEARPTAVARVGADDISAPSVVDGIATGRLRRDESPDVGGVQVYILLDEVTDTSLAALRAAGVTIELVDAPGRRVQARIPASRLAAVASLSQVTFIRTPTYARPHIGSVVTEGDRIHRADVARATYGVDGTGVKVGVISDGLKGVFATKCTKCDGVVGGPIASRDLPDATGARNKDGVLTTSSGGIVGTSFQANKDLEGLPNRKEFCAFEGAGAEGTALLEVVHDLAPGAQLSFANAGTSLEFNAAVRALALDNDVVVDDLGFFGEQADGASSVSTNTATALNTSSNRIRTYVTSAGNAADDHYFGSYVDSGVNGKGRWGIGTSGRLHLFQRTTETTDVLGLGDQPFEVIALPKDAEVVIILAWNDAAGRSSNDYDLYLIRAVGSDNGKVVARSIDRQTGGGDPLEVIDFVNRGDAGPFRIAIQNVGDRAQPRAFNMFAFAPQCAKAGPVRLAPGRHERLNYTTATRSFSAQSDAGGTPVSVISVAAICSASAASSAAFANSTATNDSCNDVTHGTIEYFSSRGPTLDGRLKPDIAAIDGVSITGAGKFPSLFFGTSAAAPHVAGIAALALQAAPCLLRGTTGALDPAASRASLRSLIVGSADALGGATPNATFGSGLANAQRTVERAKSACAK